MTANLFLGLMSGTSVDGLDIALCSFSPELSLQSADCFEIPTELRSRILHFCDNQPKSVDDLMRLDRDIARFTATSVNQFISDHQVDKTTIKAIGFHGQTLRHLPHEQISLQAGNAAILAEQTEIDVIADFRRRDLAAGGQGAPLVPAFHRYLTREQNRENVAFLNLGGIANLTLIEGDKVLGFDTGPANVLMDYWIDQQQGHRYDKNGEWAATGTLNTELLAAFNDPFFSLLPPKSTGRELFNREWLEKKLNPFADLPSEDIQRTLLELTATSVSAQLTSFAERLPSHLYVCGGGARNSLLLSRIQALLGNSISVETTEALNLSPDWMEAIAFAWLAYQFVEQQPANLPTVTGASGPRILGALYPK